MNLMDWYVIEELERWERRPSAATIQRKRWLREWAAQQPATARLLGAWLGQRLIDLGDSLRAWSRAGTATVPRAGVRPRAEERGSTPC